MKYRFPLAIISLSFFLVIGLAFISFIRYSKHKESLVNQSLAYAQENNYLKRCIDYHALINKQNISNIWNSDFVIYFTGKACSSCVESLLLLLFEEYGLEDNVSMLVDDIRKEELLVSFNDGFRLSIKFLNDNTIVPIDNVLLLKMDNGEVDYIFEYRPEEEPIFKESFEFFLFREKNSEF